MGVLIGLKDRKARRVVVASAVALGVALANVGTADAWLALGRHTRYPAEGGTWQYGFWDAKVRSYYNVNRCHGSSVSYNGSLVRSVNTAAGQWSIADKWAYNYWNATDAYYYRTC